jgi:hypothetical protein
MPLARMPSGFRRICPASSINAVEPFLEPTTAVRRGVLFWPEESLVTGIADGLLFRPIRTRRFGYDPLVLVRIRAPFAVRFTLPAWLIPYWPSAGAWLRA